MSLPAADGNLIRGWLGLPPGPWPPPPRELLGLPVTGRVPSYQADDAALRRMQTLRQYQLVHPDLATEGMNRVSQAMIAVTAEATFAGRADAVSNLTTAHDRLKTAGGRPPTPAPQQPPAAPESPPPEGDSPGRPSSPPSSPPPPAPPTGRGFDPAELAALIARLAKYPGAKKLGLTADVLAKLPPDKVRELAAGLGVAATAPATQAAAGPATGIMTPAVATLADAHERYKSAAEGVIPKDTPTGGAGGTPPPGEGPPNRGRERDGSGRPGGGRPAGPAELIAAILKLSAAADRLTVAAEKLTGATGSVRSGADRAAGPGTPGDKPDQAAGWDRTRWAADHLGGINEGLGKRAEKVAGRYFGPRVGKAVSRRLNLMTGTTRLRTKLRVVDRQAARQRAAGESNASTAQKAGGRAAAGEATGAAASGVSRLALPAASEVAAAVAGGPFTVVAAAALATGLAMYQAVAAVREYAQQQKQANFALRGCRIRG